jgi:hypothetical protein
MKFEYHPVLTLPTPDEALAMGAERWQAAMAKREQLIRDERANPLWKSWEPPIWRVVDALWGAPWLEGELAARIRANLGFAHKVNTVMLLGGWASSKTEYAANRMSRLMQRRTKEQGGIFWFLHETRPSQIDQQDPIMYKYLPANLKTEKAIMEKTTYIAYKEKTGFSEGSFVLPNHVRGRYWTYEGGVDKLQGPTVQGAWGDELMPIEFLPAVGSRVARGGADAVFFITFAPIHGHTEMVQELCDGATVCRESIAYLDPKDDGPRDVARYLGLTEGELEQLRAFHQRDEKDPKPSVPRSRPENCAAWLEGGSGQPLPPPGRKFRKVPRVLKPQDPAESRAVVFFHGSDNPFGNPLSVYLGNAGATQELARRYFYGYTTKAKARRFPAFDEAVHVIDDAAIPADGTNYFFEDPAGGRNPFWTWVRTTSSGKVYVYREWPGNYEIPDLEGVPGPWALSSGKHHDGKAGPGQDTFNLGLLDFKREIARLEGWEQAKGWKLGADRAAIKDWYPEAGEGPRERILRRFIDSRAASDPHVENDRPVTLLTNYQDIGLNFELTPGDDIDEGVRLINDLLAYDPNRPVDATNCPRLFIARSCINTIFALKIWTGRDGRKGATKDPIDNLRYFALLGLRHAEDEEWAGERGGHW